MYTITDAIADTLPSLDSGSELWGKAYKGVHALMSNPVTRELIQSMPATRYLDRYPTSSWVSVRAAYAYLQRNAS